MPKKFHPRTLKPTSHLALIGINHHNCHIITTKILVLYGLVNPDYREFLYFHLFKISISDRTHQQSHLQSNWQILSPTLLYNQTPQPGKTPLRALLAIEYWTPRAKISLIKRLSHLRTYITSFYIKLKFFNFYHFSFLSSSFLARHFANKNNKPDALVCLSSLFKHILHSSCVSASYLALRHRYSFISAMIAICVFDKRALSSKKRIISTVSFL